MKWIFVLVLFLVTCGPPPIVCKFNEGDIVRSVLGNHQGQVTKIHRRLYRGKRFCYFSVRFSQTIAKIAYMSEYELEAE